MATIDPASGTGTVLPMRKRTKTLLSAAAWAELHDALTLAIDALGDGPEDVDGPFLINCIMHQRGALRLAHSVKEIMEKEGKE